MFELFGYILFTLIPLTLGSPIVELHERDNPNPDTFVWGAVGDSWASGVSYSYNQHTDYDDNKYGCLRWNNSYGPLMAANESWLAIPGEFNFAACSGAVMANIVNDAQGDNPKQMSQVGTPRMITYHAGGNNCQFGDVVKNCVYQPPLKYGFGSYGPAYPDPAGKCAQLVARSTGYINNERGLYQDELNTIVDLLNDNSVKDNPDFKLYVLGYAHFFNLGDNYCNSLSFAPFANAPVGNSPKLTLQLRTDMNTAIQNVNDILAKVVNDVKDPRAKFIDISPAFNGHRFCEDNHSKIDQWYSSDVWLWNLNTPADDPPAPISGIEAWIANATLPNGTQPNLNGQNISVEVSDPSNGGDVPRWTLRPFHPKLGGTTAIANYVMAAAIADKIPGVIGAEPKSIPTCVEWTNCPTDFCSGSSVECESGHCTCSTD